MSFAHLTESQRWEKAFAIAAAARRAPFYERAFAGNSADNPEVWRRLPVLERAMVLENAYPRTTDMHTVPLEGLMVMSTGGSTGVARYNIMTYAEWDQFVAVQAEALRNLGIRADDRVANLFLAGHLWPSFLGVHESLKAVGSVHLPISGNISIEEMARLCAEFDATVMLSLPTLFIFLGDLAIKHGFKFPSLRLLGFAGEQMSSQAQTHLKKSLGVAEIRAVGYSSADCGLMGYACPQCPFATYHLPSGFQFLEILDESGAPCPAGQSGELLVTNLGRTSMPMVRYRIGDVGWWTGEACPCGDPNPLFTLAGRAGDDFKLGGGYIAMVAFDEAVATVSPPFSLNFQVELEDIGAQMDLRFSVECPDIEAARGQQERLREALIERIPELGVGLEKEFIRNLEIRLLDLGQLPRSPITGKVRRLKDLRVKE